MMKQDQMTLHEFMGNDIDRNYVPNKLSRPKIVLTLLLQCLRRTTKSPDFTAVDLCARNATTCRQSQVYVNAPHNNRAQADGNGVRRFCRSAKTLYEDGNNPFLRKYGNHTVQEYIALHPKTAIHISTSVKI
jgi:hypothetical protein